MSRGQTLRALVNERLAAAAEDIFVLFERTIVEYEEELCRSKEENQRKQQLLDTVLSPRENVQVPSLNPGPSLNQEVTETPWFKEEPEEQSVKQEEEQLQVPGPESSAVCVKPEESLQRQTEETQGEDISSETHFHSETEGHTEHSSDTDTDIEEHWEPFSWSAPQMDTEAVGNFTQVQIRDRSTELSFMNMSAPQSSVHSGHMSGADDAGRKKHQCPFCHKRLGSRQTLQTHIRVHTGERPYSCSNCKKHFADPSDLRKHNRIHTGEKPYRCLICQKSFTRKDYLDKHVRTHTGEKPYSCTVCDKAFSQKCNLKSHMSTHII